MSGGELRRGQDAYAREAWLAAHDAFSAADRSGLLDASCLELMATSAYMLGRMDDYMSSLQRAYRAHLDVGSQVAAARCARFG